MTVLGERKLRVPTVHSVDSFLFHTKINITLMIKIRYRLNRKRNNSRKRKDFVARFSTRVPKPEPKSA